MKAAIIALTGEGLNTARRIIEHWPEKERPELWLHQKALSRSREDNSQQENLPEDLASHSFLELKTFISELWQTGSVLIFIMATGIVVRHIAPYLQNKAQDPAVLVLDEKGDFVIPLIAGHLGGANAWARKIAEKIGGQAVITTATDVQGLTAPDEYARQLGWAVEPVAGLRQVNRFLLDKGYLKVWADYPLPENHPLRGDTCYHFVEGGAKDKAHLWISVRQQPDSSMRLSSGIRETRLNHPAEDHEKLPEDLPVRLIPRIFSLGMGCRRGVDTERILEAIRLALEQLGISWQSIRGLYSIDRKADEAGLQEAAKILGVPFQTFSADEIQAVNEERGLSSSGYVREKMGVDGVCEAASLLGTKQGVLILPKQKLNGVTVAISQEKSMW